MTRGELVTLYFKSSGSEDSHGDPVETWTPQEVEGALVYELAGSDLADADRPDGRRVKARVQLPDAAMAALPRDGLEGCRIALTARGQTAADAYWVIGSPNHAPGMPTAWSTTIEVGRTDG
jgi:hypothetical protein